MTKYAVVDVETTGFGKADRVVELAVVVFDPVSGGVVDEFETLLNPMRDIGAIDVHGVTASMVEAAPTFEEAVPTIARILGDNVLVAHNLPFDRRFLLQEFSRVGVDVDAGTGICTLKLSGERLDLACERFGINIESQHRALVDARATAQLLAALGPPASATSLRVLTDIPAAVPRTLRRQGSEVQHLPLTPSRFRVRYPASQELEMSYLNVVDAFLDDLVLTEDERGALKELASLYGIEASRQVGLHQDYLAALIAAARRDGVVSESERALMLSVAQALSLDVSRIPSVTAPVDPGDLEGLRVCFTGKALVDGTWMERPDLEALAAQFGLQPVSSVGPNCDLLVAADPASTSGKAQKARQRGIPVVSVQDFVGRLRGAPTG